MCGGNGNSNPGQGIITEVPFTVDGGGVTPANGVKAGDVILNFPFTIRSVEMMADVADTASWDIWIKAPFVFGSAAPTAANSICNGNFPALVAAQNAQLTGLGALGWTLAFPRGAYIRLNQRAAAVLTFYTLQLTIERNG